MDWKFWAGIAVGFIGIGVSIIGRVNRLLGIASLTIGGVVSVVSIIVAFSNPAPTAPQAATPNSINSLYIPQQGGMKTPAMLTTSPSSIVPPPSAQQPIPSMNVRLVESLARIKVKLRSGMSYEQLVELLDEAKVAKTMSGDISPEQLRQFTCYEELEDLWSQQTPNALLQRGIVSNWDEAKKEYYMTVEPLIKKKVSECYSY